MAELRKKAQAHAKKNSSGYAISRYAENSGGLRPKLPAPVKQKQKKSESKDVVPAISKEQAKRIKQYDQLATSVNKVGKTFGLKKQEILDAVQSGNIDLAISQFRRQAYSTIVTLIPIAEKEYAQGKRDHQAYVLNAMITQGRELAADLMQDGDRSQLADRIIDEILGPMLKGILQNMVSELQELKFVLSDKLKTEHAVGVSNDIDGRLRKIAQIMTELHKVSGNQVRRVLLGE